MIKKQNFRHTLALFGIALSALLFNACQTPTEEQEKVELPNEGQWMGYISLNDSVDMPFDIKVAHLGDTSFALTVINGEEQIRLKDIETEDDSIRFNMPVFGNYIKATVSADRMEGVYHNPDATNYHLPFKAVYGVSSRFSAKDANCCDVNKKWRVKFSPETADSSNAIAYFNQQNDTVISATFMTETGDYRYLQGSLSGNELRLSTFDGAHLFYFEASLENGQIMQGRFYSGRSFMEPWVAFRDDDFELRDADSLTFIKEGALGFDFALPTIEGDTVRLSDERFVNKAVIVQIMGSWCPNCMDETRFLRELYRAYNPEGLEIVALSFERAKNASSAIKRVEKMIRDLDIPYPVLMGGYTRDDKAGEVLSMLNHVMSYPTAIYLNKAHEVEKIHTGFAGPGTPVYEEYVSSTQNFVKTLIEE